MAEYIDKSAVVAKIDEFVEINKAHGFPVDIFDMEMLKKRIEQIPAADVAQVVHGQWGKDKEYTMEYDDGIFLGKGHFGYRCSNCGGIFDRTKFCGGCGAKMDEEG